ncbi:chromosome segregation protein SMC [Janthinobacterium lividum]|uniref:AAA family ATPase n=1 Tax=Janthinobacterium lividum TaxID=29581 RepID=UPI0015955019|nr:chromosome segregation protein SMC [Janthinobacterium lividum]QKY01481.1 chromosome segregation protein SMC [Janthinobacterium lividum]
MNMPDTTLAVAVADPFDSWIAARPRWLQTAASDMLEKRALPDAGEIEILSSLCVEEAGGAGQDKFKTLGAGSLGAAQKRPHLRLMALNKVNGVNAISNDAELEFGDASLIAIYGQNGTGKSGFSRLLKHACGSRAKEDILPNVFMDKPVTPSASLSVTYGGAEKCVDWTPSGATSGMLKEVHIFDSHAAALYFGPKNEASYEPRRIRFVTSLIKICEEVACNLDRRKTALPSGLPSVPPSLLLTAGAKWVAALTATTKDADVDARCAFSLELESERLDAEQAIHQKNIPERLASIATNLGTIATAEKYILSLKIVFHDSMALSIVKARSDAVSKRKTADEEADKVFAKTSLEGVGQETWRSLWEEARKYSEHSAYNGAIFPVTGEGSKCVLCQQELDDAAKARLVSFEVFVKGRLEAAATKAETDLRNLLLNGPSMPEVGVWHLQCGVLQVDAALMDSSHALLKTRWDAIQSSVDAASIPQFDWTPLEQKVGALRGKLEAEQKTLTELKNDDKRKALEARLAELQCMKWLSENKQSVVGEVRRRRKLKEIDAALALTKTNALTTKANELSELEVTKDYQERFLSELSLLGGKNIQISTSSKKQGKGKVSIGLSMKSSKSATEAKRVLSEGESRVVALAAFLADIAGSGEPTPFIFDDPISSLDQTYEEAVVSRLVELSKTRQVIVFTHRLSVIALLEETVGKVEKQAEAAKVPSPVKLLVHTLHKLGSNAGIVEKSIVKNSNTQKAANGLRDQEMTRLRKLLEAKDVEGYLVLAKSICSTFRTLVENSVEKVLMNGVVARFRRSVETKNKIGALAKINDQDCALIEDLMTRYSVFEHSQSNELPAETPDYDQLMEDIEKFAMWVGEFSNRKYGPMA